MPTILYSGHSGFISLFQLCVTVAFCWHQPNKNDSPYLKRLPVARTGKIFAHGTLVSRMTPDINGFKDARSVIMDLPDKSHPLF